MNSRVIVALDFPAAEPALALAKRLQPGSCRLKVGKELFTRAGPTLVKQLVAQGFDVFLDLKYHDIPNTVAQACKAAAELDVWMLNVHALGGRHMVEAARDALESAPRRPLLIAVTVLTSMSDDDLVEVGLSGSAEDNVLRLATLAHEAGSDGVVCSPREVAVLRQELDQDFVLVTPGIRPAGANKADQRRVLTPAAAIAQGSDYLVIGRPITGAADPVAALEGIHAEIVSAES